MATAMDLIRHKYKTPNVGKVERGASITAGTLLLARGLRSKGWVGAATAFIGIAFLRRGVTGFCYTYQALGINSAPEQSSDTGNSEKGSGQNVSVPHQTGIRIDEAVTVNLPTPQVFQFWRNLANVAEFMEHVESVRTLADSSRTHWTAKGPGGKSVEWQAQIINEIENELIAWRSLPGSEIPHAGSVHFKEASGGRGTEVHVEILYSPPGGSAGAMVAKLFGEDPAAQIRSDLKRLKARLEAGVLPDTEGQSAGAATPRHDSYRHPDLVGKASEESFPASDSPAFTH
ncbi:MAG: DUF2892 domain-containing protein [Acidobacteriota bacterium]|nr:DUF2892 domain-containing protein [Acidobacteriota bacterium]